MKSLLEMKWGWIWHKLMSEDILFLPFTLDCHIYTAKKTPQLAIQADLGLWDLSCRAVLLLCIPLGPTYPPLLQHPRAWAAARAWKSKEQQSRPAAQVLRARVGWHGLAGGFLCCVHTRSIELLSRHALHGIPLGRWRIDQDMEVVLVGKVVCLLVSHWTCPA